MLELLIVMSLLGVFVAGIYQTVIVGLRAVDDADERDNVRQQVTRALERLTREAKVAQTVDTAEDETFKFDADFDGDGFLANSEKDVEYKVNSGELQRKDKQHTAWVTLVTDLNVLAFDYIDKDGVSHDECKGGCTKGDLRVMQITVTAKLRDESITMDASAYLENM